MSSNKITNFIIFISLLQCVASGVGETEKGSRKFFQIFHARADFFMKFSVGLHHFRTIFSFAFFFSEPFSLSVFFCLASFIMIILYNIIKGLSTIFVLFSYFFCAFSSFFMVFNYVCVVQYYVLYYVIFCFLFSCFLKTFFCFLCLVFYFSVTLRGE